MTNRTIFAAVTQAVVRTFLKGVIIRGQRIKEVNICLRNMEYNYFDTRVYVLKGVIIRGQRIKEADICLKNMKCNYFDTSVYVTLL
jgi:hypothetical protein